MGAVEGVCDSAGRLKGGEGAGSYGGGSIGAFEQAGGRVIKGATQREHGSRRASGRAVVSVSGSEGARELRRGSMGASERASGRAARGTGVE